MLGVGWQVGWEDALVDRLIMISLPRSTFQIIQLKVMGARFSLLLPLTYSLSQALRCPFDIFFGAVKVLVMKHGFLEMFKNLLRAVEMLAKIATE